MKALIKHTVNAALFLLLTSGAANAHYFWLNAYESFAEGNGHILMFLGFGHKLPADDFLAGDTANLAVKGIEIKGPDGKTVEIPVDTARKERRPTPWGAVTEAGDLALNKFSLTENTLKGVYTVSAKSVPLFFTRYEDENGRPKFARLAMDEVKDAKKIIGAVQYNSIAKSYFTVGNDRPTPSPDGFALDIVPLRNLSNIRAGEAVSFETLFMGRKIDSGPGGMEYMTAFSDTFGMTDGYQLYSMITEGKTTFRFPTPGNWLVNVFYKKDVDASPELADLKGKAKEVFYAATLSFTVKP